MPLRKIYCWKCREHSLRLGGRTLVMGILNVTPDSFSDGSEYSDVSAAVERALEIAEQGADILDIGGESTRPGAETVPVEEEIRRTIPVISRIRKHSDIPISIDTTKAEVAVRAWEAGADIINDVSAFKGDPHMIEEAAGTTAGIVLMHRKGTPKNMQNQPVYKNVVQEIGTYLLSQRDWAVKNGIPKNRLVIDPGIGFGKTVQHNLDLLHGLPALAASGSPILIGLSRKSLIGHILNREKPKQRLAGSLALAAWAAIQGVHILRTHDITETCDVCRMVDTLLLDEP